MIYIKTSSIVSKLCSAMYIFGLWEKNDGNVYRTVAIKIIYFIHYATFLLTLGTGALLSEKKNEKLFLITMSLICVVCMVRLNYILWKKTEMCGFLHEIGAYSFEDREEFNKTNAKLKPFLTFLQCFLSLIVLGTIVASISPIFSHEQSLPLNIRLPFNWHQKKNIIYGFAYLYGVIAAVLCMLTTFYTTLIWYIMLNYSIKYQLLGQKIRDFGTGKLSLKEKMKNSNIEKQNTFLRNLVEAVEIHENIYRTVKQFQSCFSKLFFTQITISSVAICGSVFVLAFGSDNNFLQTGVYVTVATHSFFDLFMIMYLGNEIKLSSDRLSYCLFESQWTDQSKLSRKCMLILSEILQNPQKLVIAELYKLNLETFTSILQVAYSAFNILQKFN